ncbi:receptor-like serine/threonine-protein kinase SD1-8 isoform X2 [Malania oleifera]|uniref:receptor-like serine/threonine-protein kinase SD1-8 isoform X2 n=1 Tax=Malania oleifera TaxID=397392 RepID=UPI0025AE227F|nr:receptor-like serine/threonine-protein kinase SD1-8 isoform X2 [Malania oleifera]
MFSERAASASDSDLRILSNMSSALHCCLIFLCFALLSSSVRVAGAGAGIAITAAQPLADGNTIVSTGGVFELGFFGPNSSKNRYLGIWYKNIPDSPVVWVANRDNPLTDSSGVLKIGDGGNLVLLDRSGKPIWSSSNQSHAEDNPVALLLDSGNFILRGNESNDPENHIWQSFDYPTDTLLPGMKLGWDSKSGFDRFLTSWKTSDDPSSGDYSFKLDRRGFPEIFLWNDGVRVYRSGPWNGLRFSGVPEMKPSVVFNFTFAVSPNEVYYSFGLIDKSLISRLVVNYSGLLQRFTWIENSKQWNIYWYAPKDQCDSYRECGPYGICDTNASPVCKCADAFRPVNPQAWFLRDGSGGCVRKTELDCRSDGFLPVRDAKLPETSSSFVNRTMNLAPCEEMCRKNCSCTAYANSDIAGGGSGCVIWSGDLMDMRQYAEGGQDLYIRLAASDMAGRSINSQSGSNNSRQYIKIVGITVGTSILLLALGIILVWRTWRLKRMCNRRLDERGPSERSQDILLSDSGFRSKRDYTDESTSHELELPLFDFSTIVIATNNFSEANKLGQGGFGSVYKGMLIEGQEVAVKRLSKSSGQGIEEFKNEVRLIARLQHRNLVRLLGCCIEMEEKMLVYEYMQHRSLDSFIFNAEKSSLLDWQRRFNIICGIARGLLYLHQDSRFRIIHRDLKASNILLDGQMNPKISDFGMARIFGGDQTEANTKRVVGTYGYMSPEYAMDGLFSVKSDVFSFGVLVLEIVSGKKNRGFYYSNNEHNLLGHVWRMWLDDRGIELIDSSVGDSYSPQEVLKCMQVGLLCVQERAEDRPTMSSVVLMLSSETARLHQPKHPGFCLGRNPMETDSSSSKQDESFTINQVTVTTLDAR